MNLELFLAPEYYKATLERYEEIIKSKLHTLENFFLVKAMTSETETPKFRIYKDFLYSIQL